MGLLEPGWGRGAHSQPHRMKNKQLLRYVVRFPPTCSTLECRYWDGLDDGGPRFGACRGHAQDGGFGCRGASLYGAEEGGLFTIC